MATEPTPTDAAMEPCGDCGMPCAHGEYHPYAACLMFKACHNSETVRANLNAVRAQPAPAASQVPLTDEQIDALWASQKLNVPQIVNRRALAHAVEAAHGIGIKGGRNVDHPV